MNVISSTNMPYWSRRYIWWPTWFAIATAIGVLNGAHMSLNSVARGYPAAITPRMIEELTGAWTFIFLLPLIVWAARRIRSLDRPFPWTWAHAGVFVCFSVSHTSLMWGSRQLLFALLGLGHYDYGEMPWRYLMEAPLGLILYGLAVFITWLLDQFRAGRQRELDAARLESALAEARLEALRLQLNPHFLFNALNAVSATLYEQPRAADEMLARIGELLRATLSTNTQEHALADELRLLDLYLAIQRSRFGDHLQVDVDVPDDLKHVRVPFLVLQPLVENAMEHAGDDHARRVEIRASADGARLDLHVRDHGLGIEAASTPGLGIGLGNIQSRLRHLYGEAAGMRLESHADGGAVVSLWLPLKGEPL
jgi:two-component system LytT family sensor kinase